MYIHAECRDVQPPSQRGGDEDRPLQHRAAARNLQAAVSERDGEVEARAG